MMRIHIEQIKEEGLALEFEEKAQSFNVLTEMVDKGDCEFLTSIKTVLKALRVGDIIEVEGNVSTAVQLTCARCLKSFETSLKTNFALTYTCRIPDEDAVDSQHAELELKAEDMGLIYFQGEEINLQDGIQEQVVMAFPLRALCKESCKGLCPQCGKDLNSGECGCNRAPYPGKFAALKNLKLKK